MSNVKIEPINKSHDRDSFDCEVEALNSYLKEMALQHHRKDIAKTHILTFKDGSSPVIAYATLNYCDIDTTAESSVPELKKLPRVSPALRLCQLAVDKKYKGKGLGKHLMGFILAKAVSVSEDIGCCGIVVDAKDRDAKAYYEQFGFIEFASDPLKLFLPIKTVRQLAESVAAGH